MEKEQKQSQEFQNTKRQLDSLKDYFETQKAIIAGGSETFKEYNNSEGVFQADRFINIIKDILDFLNAKNKNLSKKNIENHLGDLSNYFELVKRSLQKDNEKIHMDLLLRNISEIKDYVNGLK